MFVGRCKSNDLIINFGIFDMLLMVLMCLRLVHAFLDELADSRICQVFNKILDRRNSSHNVCCDYRKNSSLSSLEALLCTFFCLPVLLAQTRMPASLLNTSKEIVGKKNIICDIRVFKKSLKLIPTVSYIMLPENKSIFDATSHG